jgi:hypothetical protein
VLVERSGAAKPQPPPDFSPDLALRERPARRSKFTCYQWSVLLARVTIAAWLVALVVVSSASHAFADCDDPFTDPDRVLDLHLRTTSVTWAEFQTSRPEPDVGSGLGGGGLGGCEDEYPYFEAEFRCGDREPWLSVGFRRKRDRTESVFKLPIKLDINRFVDDQRWPAARGAHGFRRLTLNSGQPDEAVAEGDFAGGDDRPRGVLSALLTEHLAWRVMREELPEVSGSAYARLTVHLTDTSETRYAGLYILIEDIDRTAVHARYGLDGGALYKTTDATCPESPVFEDPPPNPTTEGFETWLALDPNDFPGTWYERTDQAMELDGLLRQEALRELLANTEDTILGRMNNYYALDLHGRRRVYLPWDLDDVFRPEPQAHPPQTPLVSSCVGNGGTCATIPLGVNIRDQAELRPHYLETLCRLSNGVGNEQRLVSQLTAIDEWLRPLIADEVPLLWEPRGEDPLDATTPGTYAAEVERMKEWIPARIAAVREMIEDEGTTCAEGCEAGTSVPCTWFGLPSSRSCDSGMWSACLPVAMGDESGAAMGPGEGDGGGCGCRQSGRPDAALQWLFALAGPLVVAARRRRKS